MLSSTLLSYHKIIDVTQESIDENQHVNNVVYVHWMQDMALEHHALLLHKAQDTPNTTWVARSHSITYLQPAFLGENLRVTTSICNVKRAGCVRLYTFTRLADGALLAKGQTHWVCIDKDSGRPKKISESLMKLLSQAPQIDS